MANAKIIGIHDGKHIETNSSARPLPMPIIQLRDEVKDQIKVLLRELFDNADDALFAMADKAGTNGDQSIYLESMRELRLQKKFIANSFMQQVTLSFTNVDQISNVQNERADSFDFENLSILKNDDLEISVALEGMISRLRNKASSQLDDLNIRLESLLETNTLKSKHIPAGPEVLCDAFAFASSELEVDLKAKLVIFKLFEKYVLSEMPQVYLHANQVMGQAGVLPNLKKQRYVNNSSGSTNNNLQSGADRSPGSSHYGSETQTVPMLGKEQCLTEGQFEQIRTLMHSHDASYQSAPSATNTSANVIFLNQEQILSTLSQQQTYNLGADSNEQGYQPIDFRNLISSAYVSAKSSESGKEVKYDEIDNDIINLVSMLFDFILDDRQLQPAMKALIARLQIPILKVALIDKTFFDRGGHPARKLLNEMASAAIGWTEKNTGKSDRLKAKIEHVVERVLSEFQSNITLFEELLNEFKQFTDLESRRGQLIEQRTKDSERGKAATELAKKAAETVINTVFQSKLFSVQEIPACVVTLLQDGWSRVMILDYLKLGDESLEWKGHQQFIYDLVWSVCPTSDGSDARAKLLQLIPPLMDRLHQGLEEASFDDFRLKQLLADLEKQHVITLKRLHKDAIKQQEIQSKLDEANKLQLDAQMAIKPEPVVTLKQDSEEESFKDCLDIDEDFKEFESKLSNKEINEVLNSHISETDPDSVVKISLTEDVQETIETVLDESDPFMQQVSRFSVGCWFEFSDNGQSERAKLAAVIRVNGRYIFVNRSGVKIAEKTKQELALELKAGQIQVLNDGLLFDRALESIIGNLRGQA